LTRRFPGLEGKTVPAGGEKHFHRRKIPAFYPKNRTGAGKGRFPGYFEMSATEAVGGAGSNNIFLNRIATHLHLTA